MRNRQPIKVGKSKPVPQVAASANLKPSRKAIRVEFMIKLASAWQKDDPRRQQALKVVEAADDTDDRLHAAQEQLIDSYGIMAGLGTVGAIITTDSGVAEAIRSVPTSDTTDVTQMLALAGKALASAGLISALLSANGPCSMPAQQSRTAGRSKRSIGSTLQHCCLTWRQSTISALPLPEDK